MKHLTAFIIVFGLLMSVFETDLLAQGKGRKGGPPGLQKKGGVPPGLQKKGGLPPGQAKKLKRSKNRTAENAEDLEDKAEEKAEQVREARPEKPEVKAPAQAPERSAPTRTTTARTSRETPAPEPTVKTAAKPAPPLKRVDPNKKVSRELQRRRDRLSEHVSELNGLGKSPASRDKILDRLSKATRIPAAELQAQMKQHPNLGAGDFYVAHRIAKKAKQPVDRLIAQHEAGHSWGVLANEYKAGLPDLVDNTREMKSAAQRASKR